MVVAVGAGRRVTGLVLSGRTGTVGITLVLVKPLSNNVIKQSSLYNRVTVLQNVYNSRI